MARKAVAGRPFPLGATPHPESCSVGFSLFAEHATAVEVCLFDKQNREERLLLPERCNGVFCGSIEGVGAGQLYGYRVHGPWQPELGHRFNPAKLVMDPYARAIVGNVDFFGPLNGQHGHDRRVPPHRDDQDSAGSMCRSMVVYDPFDWSADVRPRVPLDQTVIYECHVKSMTAALSAVPEDLRGTYLGLAHPAVIEHLKRLGVTSIELLPVHHSLPELSLVRRGQTNYWGYNTLSYFAPDARYAHQKQGGQVNEFKRMVHALHAAGFEVLLDVVYNHTCEGDEQGPTLCFRGVDNAVYYALSEPKWLYQNVTGCGNSLNVSHPQVLQLVLDSLRYWVTEMHVDGFRFDLGPALALIKKASTRKTLHFLRRFIKTRCCRKSN